MRNNHDKIDKKLGEALAILAMEANESGYDDVELKRIRDLIHAAKDANYRKIPEQSKEW